VYTGGVKTVLLECTRLTFSISGKTEVLTMNAKRNVVIMSLLLLWSAFGLVGKASGVSQSTDADQLVSQHLDAIAAPAVRAGLKTRVVQGPVQFRILVGGAGTVDGKAFLVSEGRKLQFMMKLPNNEYRGEQFVFDGDKDKVAFSSARQTRSAFGSFVFVQDAVVREGLLGGVLSTAWPLLQLNERKAKVSFDGLKKIDGQELYEIRYHPKKSSDLEINLYFDPQTYRHVETIYSYTTSQALVVTGPGAGGGAGGPGSMDSGPTTGLGGESTETSAARQLPNRYRLQEKFSDFTTVDGLTVPTHDNIQFSQELQGGRTNLWEWDLKGLEVSNNVGVDARNFDVK
jgi:hypothetical protein